MAPLKLEDNIREQFENREIKPSADAWNTLADRLDEQQKGPKKGIGIWWAIAAGIVGLAILGSLLFSSDPSRQNNEMVVEDQSTEIPANEEVQQQKPLIEEAPEKEVIASEDKPAEIVEPKTVEKKLPVQKKEQQAVAKTDPVEIQENKSPELIAPKIEDAVATIDSPKTEIQNKEVNAVDAKVAEVVDKIKELEATNTTVSEAEIAELLDQAQRDLKAKSQINMETLKVDANALLMDVEYDLERSFRDKVFDALGDGYNKIRTAMATRNN